MRGYKRCVQPLNRWSGVSCKSTKQNSATICARRGRTNGVRCRPRLVLREKRRSLRSCSHRCSWRARRTSVSCEVITNQQVTNHIQDGQRGHQTPRTGLCSRSSRDAYVVVSDRPRADARRFWPLGVGRRRASLAAGLLLLALAMLEKGVLGGLDASALVQGGCVLRWPRG